jgi:chaperone BCS1
VLKPLPPDPRLTIKASTMHIQPSNESYDMVQSWISSHGYDETARSILAKVKTKLNSSNEYDSRTKKSLCYAPWKGSFVIWYKKNLLYYQTKLVDVGFHEEERISITCVGRPRILKSFVEDCRLGYLDELKNKTTIFGHHDDHWKKEKSVVPRPLSTIILDAKQKESLIKDIEDFLDPQTRLWYSEHSMPYKRGYLLHGSPGTGKSSFTLSIASKFDMDIYVVSIPSTNDKTLKCLFDALPVRCVVLLEDIDAAGAACSRDFNAEDSDGDAGARMKKNGVTLSGLLNLLDGVASQEDRVLVMTTNHPEKLDRALIRPGRVDKKVEFQLANRGIAKEIFHFIFGEHDSQQKERGEMESYADKFAAIIPESELSPAEIISYLLPHRFCPAVAIEQCSQWVDDLRQEKQTEKRRLQGWN